MPAGSLWDVLHDRSVPQLLWSLRAKVLLETALGMLYLHNRSEAVLHRDLKSPNLLLDDTMMCKVMQRAEHLMARDVAAHSRVTLYDTQVCDFGLSRLVSYGEQKRVLGTCQWTAPEVFTGSQHVPASDVWSFGVVAWECVTRQCPFGREDPVKLVHYHAARHFHVSTN